MFIILSMINTEFNIAVYIPTFEDFPSEESSLDNVINEISLEIFSTFPEDFESEEMDFNLSISPSEEVEVDYDSESESAELSEVEDYSSEELELDISASENESDFGEQNLALFEIEEKDFFFNFYVLFEKARAHVEKNQWDLNDGFHVFNDRLANAASELYQSIDMPEFFDVKKGIKKKVRNLSRKKENQSVKIISHK